MTPEILKARVKKFALDALTFIETLLPGAAGWTVARQLAKSSTSVGANYRSALRAKSDADFLCRIKTVEEEADESVWWLELCRDKPLGDRNLVLPLLKEVDELTAIFAATAISMRARIAREKSLRKS